MNRLFAAMLVCAMTMVVANSYGQCSDPRDHTLCVHYLSAADSTAFATSSPTALTGFWSNWAAYDSIDMYPPDNCYPGRCNFVGGATDAELIVKAAANSIGLYMLTRVADNIWVDPANGDDWGADATDLYFADEDSATIATCTDCRIGLYSNYLTFTTQQFQTWMRASGQPTGARVAYYDANLWTWTTIAYDWATMKALLGIQIKVVSIDATHKAQEWFFPWDRYGTGLADGTARAGKRVAFSGGYNDKDGDNANPDCLRWTGNDPWDATAAQWGDFLLAADMPPVKGVTSVRGGSFASRSAAAAKVLSSEYFTLSGQKLTVAALRMQPGNLVVKVSRLADGHIQRQMVRAGQ